MAAFLGAALGAFVVYFSLGSFGTGGVDLSDLTVLVWYSLLGLIFLRSYLRVSAVALQSGLGFLRLWLHCFLFFWGLVVLQATKRCSKMFHALTKRLQPQKKRSVRLLVPQVSFRPRGVPLSSWIQFLSQKGGLISWRLVERVFIWGKRLVRYPRKRARF
jgi:hypothetical protein